MPVPNVNPVAAEVVPLALNENPVAVVVVAAAAVVAAGVADRLNPVPVDIVLGVPNVNPVAAVDAAAVASPPPKPNPPVSGLVANADVAAVVVVAVVVPPRLKVRVLPVTAGEANPVAAVVVVVPSVNPVVAVVPAPNVKPVACGAAAVFAGAEVGVPKLKPVPWPGVLPKPNIGLFCAGEDVSENPAGFAASPAPVPPNVNVVVGVPVAGVPLACTLGVLYAKLISKLRFL